MSSVILRFFLGSLLVLGLAFPINAMAEQGNSGPAASSAEFLNVNSMTYQQADDDSMSQPDPTEEEVPIENRQALGTILNYTLYGGGLGTLVGFAGYVISGFDWTPWTIAGFAGGGALLGAGLGTYRVMNANQDQMAAQSVEYMKRDVPKAVEVPVMKLKF